MTKKKLTEAQKLENYIKRQGMSIEEAKRALRSANALKPYHGRKLEVGDKSFSFCYFSDPHIGHEQFKPRLFEKMVNQIKEQKPDFTVTPGDNVEGMSGRPGHVYELTHIGFNNQIKYAAEFFNEIPTQIYGIDGNHDQWYEKKNNGGVIVGESLAHRVNNYTFLGQDEGDLFVDGIHIKLFHAGDGTAYAHSYKLQKLVESFSGGEKPHVVLSGHYHKALYQFSRNIHGFECGTLMGQSKWMRTKKIQAHMGYGFVTVHHNGRGSIDRLIHEFVPYYEKKKTKTNINIDQLRNGDGVY